MRILLRRLAQLAVVLVLVTLFTAMLIEMLPGDPVKTLAPFADDRQRDRITQELDLDEPLPVRYVHWLGGFVTGDLGNYYTVQSTFPVWDNVKEALPVSLLLMLYAQVLALAIAIPIGVLTAFRAGSLFDRASNTLAFAFLAMPTFVLATVLIYLLAIQRDWLPSGTWVPFGEDPAEHFRHAFLPAVSLAVGQIAVYMRLLRSDMIATLQEDFITMAKAKGVPSRRILFRHALRPSSLTLLTVAALNVGTLVGGALIIEVIFGLPGLGKLVYDAIARRQYVALQSLVAIIAVGYVLVNFIVDVLYGIVDPRIRHARAVA